MSDIPPIELSFIINLETRPASPPDVFLYELPVFENGGGSHKEQIEFLVNCDYDFYTPQSTEMTNENKSKPLSSLNG
jgi:hypothetical protein